MKDYKLIRYIAKLTGAKPKRDRGSLFCYFPFNEACIIPVFFTFKKGKSEYVFFDLTDVYKTYGEDKYPSYEKFINAFVAENNFFKAEKISDNLFVTSDLNVNRIQHVASQALMNVSVVVGALGEMLGLGVKTYSEEDWRNLHRSFLANQKRNSIIGGLCSLGILAAGIINLVLVNGTVVRGFLAFIVILLFFAIPVGIVGIIYFYLKYCHYKKHLKNSLKEKEFS